MVLLFFLQYLKGNAKERKQKPPKSMDWKIPGAPTFHLDEETKLRKAENPVKPALQTKPILAFASYDHHINVVSTVNTVFPR